MAQINEQFGWETANMGGAEAARAIEPLCMLWCIPGFVRNDWTHAFKLLLAFQSGSILACLLRQPRRSRENAFGTNVNVQQIDSPLGQFKFAQLIRVGHTTRLENVQGAVPFTAQFDISHKQPRIHDGRNLHVSLLYRVSSGGQIC